MLDSGPAGAPSFFPVEGKGAASGRGELGARREQGESCGVGSAGHHRVPDDPWCGRGAGSEWAPACYPPAPLPTPCLCPPSPHPPALFPARGPSLLGSRSLLESFLWEEQLHYSLTDGLLYPQPPSQAGWGFLQGCGVPVPQPRPAEGPRPGEASGQLHASRHQAEPGRAMTMLSVGRGPCMVPRGPESQAVPSAPHEPLPLPCTLREPSLCLPTPSPPPCVSSCLHGGKPQCGRGHQTWGCGAPDGALAAELCCGARAAGPRATPAAFPAGALSVGCWPSSRAAAGCRGLWCNASALLLCRRVQVGAQLCGIPKG